MLGAQCQCLAGQGEEGKVTKELEGVSLDEGKDTCVGFSGCFGIDYSKTDTYRVVSSCRLYGLNEPTSDAVNNHRSYCELLGKSKQDINYINLVFVDSLMPMSSLKAIKIPVFFI